MNSYLVPVKFFLSCNPRQFYKVAFGLSSTRRSDILLHTLRFLPSTTSKSLSWSVYFLTNNTPNYAG